MKIFIYLLAWLTLVSVDTWAGSSSSFEQFQARATEHRRELEVEGLSYMAGGGLGLVSSLTLGITSKEIFPRIGYSLMQTLSSAAIAYGGILYFTGDELTREADKMRDLSAVLSRAPSLSPSQRQKILDEATQTAITRALERRKTVKRIRGVLELTTAASAGATLAFSQTSGTASNVTLGFIILITTVGGISDLWTADSKAGFDAFTASLLPLPGSPGLALSYHW